MKCKQELTKYKSEIIEEYGSCTILKVKNSNFKKNCSNTGDRKAIKGWSWIDYWRSMTGIANNLLTCASCGKIIYAGPIPKMMEKMFYLTGDKPENHVAQGGHVWVNAPSNASYRGGRYIVPLCPYCNGQHDKDILILAGSILCKEVGTNNNEQ